MNTKNLELLIADCFEYINENDPQVASYWCNQLFTKQGDIKKHMITEFVLQRLESDVAKIYDNQGA